MIAVIDNYDSFTFNLVQLLGELKAGVRVYKNDEITMDALRALSPTHIIISPGPGVPSRSGISKNVIREFYRDIPILGVCLGFQAIAEVFGGQLKKTQEIYHGKTSQIFHSGRGLFRNISSPMAGMRYHSWEIDEEGLDESIEMTAKTEAGLPMALAHRDYRLYGVQFHPESILTPEGKKIIENFMQ